MDFLRKLSSGKLQENEQPAIGKVLIVGGGPAGALSAKALSDRNFDVTLCESYPHPSGSDEKRHAYVISLNARGLRALSRVGIDPLKDIDGGVENHAYVRHGTSATAKAKVITKDEASLVIRRQRLTSELLKLAKQAGAKVHCGEKLSSIDFEKRVATFVSPDTGKETKRGYDLLIGADGVNSATRTLLENADLLGPTRKVADDMEYQVAVLPQHWKSMLQPDAVELVQAPDVSVHTYANRASNSNSLVFPLQDGESSLVCVISPQGKLDELKANPDGYTSFLSVLYPNWTESAQNSLANQLAEEDNVVTTGGTCVWTSALAAPQAGTVLVGDSGHAMWPSLGQGCNTALESAAVLVDAVEAVCGDSAGTVHPSAGAGVRKRNIWDVTTGERGRWIAEEFDGLRREDAAAIVDLTFGGIGGRRVRGAQNGKLLFMLQMAVMMILHKLTLKVVPMPALMRVMTGKDDVPFSTLLWQHKCEKMGSYAILSGIFYLIGTSLLQVFNK